jgi:hypothetical protein
MEYVAKITELQLTLDEEFSFDPSCTILKATKNEDGTVTILFLKLISKES